MNLHCFVSLVQDRHQRHGARHWSQGSGPPGPTFTHNPSLSGPPGGPPGGPGPSPEVRLYSPGDGPGLVYS